MDSIAALMSASERYVTVAPTMSDCRFSSVLIAFSSVPAPTLQPQNSSCDYGNYARCIIRNSLTLLHLPREDAACALTKWQHFSARNDDMAAILKIRLHQSIHLVNNRAKVFGAIVHPKFIPIRFEMTEP